tara:strand:+ start:1823 stop:2167 length:345 start_codon:yes stop_codon:yes gene_type:complete
MGLIPYERAKKLLPTEEEFFKILDYCGKHGVIVSNEKVFACGYKTHTDVIKTAYSKKYVDKLNCWFIYLLAGHPKDIFSMAGTIFDPMEYICFERFDDKYRIYEYEKIKIKFKG